MLGYQIWIVILFLLNTVISYTRNLLIPTNGYIAERRTSIVLAFVFAIINNWPAGKSRFKTRRFYVCFRATGIVFLLRDFLFFVL